MLNSIEIEKIVMTLNRKDFVRKVCLSGACLCGFASLPSFAKNDNDALSENSEPDEQNDLTREWLSSLLSNLDEELDDVSAKKILKKLSVIHYNHLSMNEFLAPFIGNLDDFITFIEKEWDWKITYDRDNDVLIADENKNYCVCPILKYQEGKNTSVICHCSEGFAEKMFSTVSGKPAQASVISSIRKGDNRCVYRVIFKD